MKPSSPTSLVQLCFRLLLGVSATALAVRSVEGSFSPLNAESFLAISFVILIWLRSHSEALQKQSGACLLSGRDAAVVALIAACIVISFAGTLHSPLIFDDYTHIDDMTHATWRGLIASFTIPNRRIFFRPVGFVLYWLDYKWAGNAPFRWHLSSLAVHALNSGLMYVLLRQFRMARLAAGVGALVFALQASRAEAVCWTDARFDLLSTFFVILCLILLNRYLDTNRVWLFLLSILWCTLAIFTKEATFCLPLLVLCLIPFRDRQFRSRLIQAAIMLSAVCVAGFAYRWWVLEGFGGYAVVNQRPVLADFNFLRISKALFFRLWALLYFPINWSVEPGWLLRIGIVAIVATMAAFCLISSANRSRLVAAVAFVIASALPVAHLLLIGADMNGSRLLYLPVAGVALIWGVLFDGPQSLRAKLLLGAGLLLFQAAALQHNLQMWRTVPVLARNACTSIGTELARDPRPVEVRNLPIKHQGVYFLANGFPQCVALNSGQDAGRIRIDREPYPPVDRAVRRLFKWDDESQSFKEIMGSN